MPSLQQRLIGYLQAITGDAPDLQCAAGDRVAGLPLFLRERYRIHGVRLFGKKLLLALENQKFEKASPAEYGSHARTMHEKIGEPVIIVIPAIPSYVRNRMVQAGVPFIVPGNQMFLPFIMVDLRERFGRVPAAPGGAFTPAAQCIFLYHLLRQSLAGGSLRNIAEKVGYSPMMMSRAKNELEAAGLCESVRQGRSLVLEFHGHGPSLWKRALPFLSSPVQRSHWVKWPCVGYPAVKSGLTALSRYSMIEDDRIPTYALPRENYRINLERGLFHGSPGPSEADVQLEAWAYNPLLLGTSECVDPLSLYLSLRDSADERVRQQLETLIGEVEWA